jgi:para-nitrobenzyl esterase
LGRGAGGRVVRPAASAGRCVRHGRAASTAFSGCGDPGWPAYDAEQRLTQLFDARSAVVAYPEEVSRRIWQDHTFSAMPLIDV